MALGEFYGSHIHNLEDAVIIFSFLALDIYSLKQDNMNPPNKSVWIADLKKNLRCLYEIMSIGIMDNKALVQEVKDMGEVVSCNSY